MEKISDKIQITIHQRAQMLFEDSYKELCKDTDKVFTLILASQWIAAIVVAIVVSPRTWIGAQDLVSAHIYAATVIGALLSVFPIYLNLNNPGNEINRYVNVIAQGFYSALFIHLSGGRIETHFHVFGSLAFFAFYRDIKILILGSAVIALDHAIRGVWFPLSAFGITNPSQWRWLEHTAWVVFEDIFLGYSCIRGIAEMKLVALKTAEVMMQHEHAEDIVKERTQLVNDQQMQLVNASKMSSLGEMAGGIAHEINNPVTIISSTSSLLRKLNANNSLSPEKLDKHLEDIQRTVLRISKIINGLKVVSRDATGEEFSSVKIRELMDDVLGLSSERLKNHGINLIVDLNDEIYNINIDCRRIQLSQAFINLLSNALDAIENLSEKWIKIECRKIGSTIEFKVIDSGPGIPMEIQEKIFNPFFTTKPIGKGTGLGLSISHSIIKSHHGTFTVDNKNPNTTFVITIPSQQKS